MGYAGSSRGDRRRQGAELSWAADSSDQGIEPPGDQHVARPILRTPGSGYASAETQADLLAEAERAVKDRYRIEHLAGAGGMSRVFSAREAGTGRRVAVKLLRVRDPSPRLDPTLRLHHRLVNEARSMSRLDHRHLCKVLDVSIQGDIPYLVMEWADGVDLRAAWRDQDRRHRLALFLKVVDAIAAAHHEGVVHGDLKPDNILVDRRGEPTIVDFGLARSERDGPMGLAGPGGTPGYAPPEAFETGAPVAPATDVFSLGVLLFELLTDQTPWPDDLAPAILVEQMKHSDPPLPEQFRPDTPADLQRICLAALEREPAKRYASAEEMAADLRRSLRREGVLARPSVLVRRFDAQVRRTIDATREWLRLGLISPEAAGQMLSRLNAMERAESPWVADARRATWTAAALQTGGTLIVLGLVAGLGLSGPFAGSLPALALVWTLALGLIALGVRLVRRQEQRIGSALLWAALLCAPAAAWLTVDRALGLGGQPALPASTMRWLSGLIGGHAVLGPTDAQLAAVSLAGLIAALIARWAARSSAFTLAAVAFAFTGWLSLAEAIGAAPGLMVLAFGVALIGLGLSLDWEEERESVRVGAARGRPRDARMVLGVACLATLVGSVVWAAVLPDALFGGPIGQGSGLSAWGAGLLLGAIAPGLLSFICAQRATPIRARIASLARWQAATQLIVGLALLELGAALGTPIGEPLLWFAGLLAGSALAIYVGVRLKWRGVLFAGQLGLAVWTVRLFARAEGPGPTAALAAIIIALGLALMLTAWQAPAWRERAKLRRWAKRRKESGEGWSSKSWG